MKESIITLRDHLIAVPNGKIKDTSKVDSLLAQCWDDLAGKQGGMSAEKLFNRTEDMEWNSPILTFRIERHGGTVFGSAYAELQYWMVNVETGIAKVAEINSKRRVKPLQPSLDVNPIAEEIVGLILAGTNDERLKWYGDAKVRISISKIIPNLSAPKQTIAGRRKRLGKAIEARLKQHGREKVGIHTFETHRANR